MKNWCQKFSLKLKLDTCESDDINTFAFKLLRHTNYLMKS